MERRVTNHIPVEKIIRAFSNKKRIDILDLLKKSPELSVVGIADKLHIEYKLVSAHLKTLNVAGLILKKYSGTSVLHKLSHRGEIVLKFVRTLE